MNCPHFWLCAPPYGPVSTARCKRCGVVKTFANSLTAAQQKGNTRSKFEQFSIKPYDNVYVPGARYEGGRLKNRRW